MDSSETNGDQYAAPPAATVLAAIGDALPSYAATFDRLEIQQGSLGEYGVVVTESYGQEPERFVVSVLDAS